MLRRERISKVIDKSNHCQTMGGNGEMVVTHTTQILVITVVRTTMTILREDITVRTTAMGPHPDMDTDISMNIIIDTTIATNTDAARAGVGVIIETDGWMNVTTTTMTEIGTETETETDVAGGGAVDHLHEVTAKKRVIIGVAATGPDGMVPVRLATKAVVV